MILHYYGGSSDKITEKNNAFCFAVNGGPGSSQTAYTNRYFYIDITSNGTLTIENQSKQNNAPSYELVAETQIKKNFTDVKARDTDNPTIYDIKITNYDASTAKRLYFIFKTKPYISKITWTPASSCTSPKITTEPKSANYSVGATATPLQVAATSDGTLTYQWQSSTDNTPFTDIPNATNDTYTPPTDKAGTFYYRCIVSSGTCTATSASATITVAADNTVYLRPNSNWLTDNARFAVYAFIDDSHYKWIDATPTTDCESIYTFSIPNEYSKFIFCRMQPNTENSWSNAWNQTSDLSVNDGKVYTIVEGAWSKGNGSWAIYTPSYLVSFNMNGHGDAVSDQCVQSGATITQPTAPTATGYIFAGWYADQACTQEWDFATTISTATTLYAKWNEDLTSPISIKGSWDSWKVHTLEKKPGETSSVAYITLPITQAKTYAFGFLYNETFYQIPGKDAKPMTRETANGTPWSFYKSGAITDGGTADCNIEIDYTGDYTFKADYSNADHLVITVTYPAFHTITYQEGRPDEYGSSLTTYGIPTTTTQVADGGTLTLPDYTTIKIAAGSTTVYEFAGWNDGKTTYPANQSTIDNITSNLTLTAIWKPVSFHIYYWDGQNEDNSRNTAINGLTPTTYTYPSKDPLPTDAAAITDAAKKQGYVFKNWKVRDWSKTEFTLKDLDYTTPYHLYGDINLYAEWEEEVGCVTIAKGTYASSGDVLMTSEIGTISIVGKATRENNAVKLSGNNNDYFCVTPPTDKAFLAGDVLTVTFKFKSTSKTDTMGFVIKDDNKQETERRKAVQVPPQGTVTDTYILQKDDINKDGSIHIYRLSSNDRFYAIQVEQCQNVETITATVKPGGGIIDEADATSLGYSKQVQNGGMIWYTITVAKGSHITLPTATFAGYEFDCYQAEDAALTKYAAGEKIALNEDMTFIAQWHTSSTGKVKATLNLNGGTFKSADEQAQWTKEPATTDSYYILINKGADLTLPEVVPPTGKTFVCFTDQNDDKYDPYLPFPISANYDFVAQWCVNPVALVWDGLDEGGTFTINPTSRAQIPTLKTVGLPADGEIKYTSSDEAVAIIRDNGTEIVPFMAGTTTITASYDGDGDYCPAEASYTLTVICNDATPVIEAENMSLGCNRSITLCVKAKSDDGTITDYTAEGISFQWYKNGEPIDGATGSTYTVQTIGDYFVVVHDFCYAQSENTAHITSDEGAATPEVVRLSPFLFYRPGHTYPAEQTARHLFTYKSAGSDSKACRLSAVCKRNGTRTEIMDTDLTFLQTSDTPDAQGRYTITTSLNNIPASLGWQAGDTVIVTLTPYDNCDKLSPAYADSIAIRIINRPALAFIISSADRPTRNRKNYKLHGDFLKINEADLCEQAKSDWNKWDDNVSHKELPLYTAIKEKFEVVPVNGYADFNILNYEPFDIIVLTDFLRTTMGEGDKIAPVIDSLAKLVDYRPLLSLKAHMAKDEFPTWKTKGFTGNPAKPSSTQKDMTVLCLAHGIFEGLDAYQGTAPTEDDYANKIIYDSNGNIVVRITSKGGYDDNKALQGFKAVDAANFINIAIISDGGNGSLVTCCERQTNINARMLVLSVNADATSLITPIGEKAIIRGLEYLLQTDPVKVSDCSVTFDNGGTEQRTGSGDHLWANAANWSTGRVPIKEQNVQIAENCIVNIQDATAATIKIVQGKTLTIQPTGALVANGKILAISNSNDKYNAQPVSDPGMITILASETATGALIHTTEADEQLSATVQLYSKAYFEWVDGKRKKYWQYIGVPIQEAQVPQCFQGAYTWLWTESEGWTRKADGTSLEQFYGYGLSTGVTENERVTYTLQGSLATATNREIPLTINNAVDDYRGTNMIGNSWTAPICIDKMEDTDFGTAPATIYMYNTGRDPESGSVVGDNTTTTAGQWLSIPINLVKQSGYTGPKVIPAMQAFDVLTTSETSLYLDYNRLVRSGATANLNTPLYAPKRSTTNESGQVSMMKIMVADSRTHTNLYLLEDNAFSDQFDNGWEAEFMSNDGRSASLYAISPIGNMAVSAVADIDGATLGFEKGMEDQYTFSFAYTGRMLYLNDIQQKRSTLITDWNTYTFTTSENDDINRFYISSTPIDVQTPTGIADLTTTDGILRLSNPAHEDLQIGIYDAAGRLCALSHTTEAMTDIALPSTQGVYLIHINGENTRIVHKVTR